MAAVAISFRTGATKTTNHSLDRLESIWSIYVCKRRREIDSLKRVLTNLTVCDSPVLRLLLRRVVPGLAHRIAIKRF